MRLLNILVVEDEILIAETIKIYLEERGHQVLNIAISFDEAMKAFHLRKPDIVLLDIRLYGPKSGIDFANFLKEQKESVPFIYITSQYDHRILEQALETNPYGYLTKPIHKETLWTSVSTAYRIYETKAMPKYEIKLFDGKSYQIIDVNDIIYIEADHVYLNITLSNETTLTIRQTLKQLLSELPDEIMVQCHRSYIINRNFIKSWNSSFITLKNNKQIPISRNFIPD
jgi:DNA-binding LytR/AlgR family response regulator